MSYSKEMLSKKGALWTVWVAGVRGVAALTRDQVLRTDVAASADKISKDIETAYRILGLLLLGVVRIYSKKVEYFCHDCDQLLESFETAHCTEQSTSTGGSTNGVLMQVKKGVRARRLVVGQENFQKVKKRGRSARTSAISGLISSEGLSSRAETGDISQLSLEVREAIQPSEQPIFTIPKRFELDCFDLQIAENRDGGDDDDHHQLPRQDTLLEDEQHRTSYLYEMESYQRMTCSNADLGLASFMPTRITLRTEMISFIDEVSNLFYSSNRGDELEIDNQNADSVCFTPVKDVLPPEMMNMMAEVHDPSEKSKTAKNPTREVNRDENGDSACSIPLPEIQEMPRSANVGENVTCSNLDVNCPTIEESGNELLLGRTNTGLSVEIPYHDIEEQESLEPPTARRKTRSINELSPSTPERFPERATGLLENFMVTTPAKKERRQVTRKRRRELYSKVYTGTRTDEKDKRRVKRRGTLVLYDEDIVLPNDMMRQAIVDANDLVCKRKKAPHTYLDAWKVAIICSLPDTFMDPLFPCSTSVHLSYSTTGDAPESSRAVSVKAKKRLSYELAESNNFGKGAQNAEREGSPDETIPDETRKRKLDELADCVQTPVCCDTQNEQLDNFGKGAQNAEREGSPDETIPDETRKRKLDELADCVQTPVCCDTQNEQFEDVSQRNDDTGKENNRQVKGDRSSSTEPQEKRLYESRNRSPLFNEALTTNIDNIDVDIPMDEEYARDEGCLLSARTRTVAKCLHQLFVDQKQQGNTSATLGQALKGRKRKTTARFFYETLILKSLGLIEVNQENPYENIEILPTPHLEAVFQNTE